MPKRTNEFQQVVAYIYSQIVPSGGRVTESAFLREDGTGEPREIDVLIDHKIVGHDIKIAVECRDYTREQNVEWIDQLIGKYSRLRVNQIVAVSSSPFSEAAKIKAAKHNIEAITVNEALTTDWINRIERWKGMTHSFTLMRIVTLDANGSEITYSEVSPDGTKATHRDQDSEYMYNVLQPFFMEHLSKAVGKALEAKIAERWQYYVDDPTPRWAEIVINKPGITRHGKDIGVEKVVFGIGTFFHVSRPSDHLALKEHALSQIKIPLMKGEAIFRMITDPQGNVLKFDVGDA
jgi:Restriction endonuclease